MFFFNLQKTTIVTFLCLLFPKGECGIRGGYVELINLEPTVRAAFKKSISAQLCPNTLGQVAIDVVVNPPKKGETSYEQWHYEKVAVLDSLQARAKLVVDTFNSFEGVTCCKVQGAIYAFPQVRFPPKAIEAAKQNGQPADIFYAFQLLEETGMHLIENEYHRYITI